MGKSKKKPLRDGYIFESIITASDKREVDIIESGLKCLTFLENMWVNTYVLIHCSSAVAGTFVPNDNNKHFIILSEQTFERGSYECCVRVVLHELCHALLHGKVLKLPKKIKEEKFCDDFARQRLKDRAKHWKLMELKIKGDR